MTGLRHIALPLILAIGLLAQLSLPWVQSKADISRTRYPARGCPRYGALRGLYHAERWDHDGVAIFDDIT